MFGDPAPTKFGGPPPVALHFPTFLLPQLKFPFRRRRASTAPSRDDPGSPAVPSLSNSPTSSRPSSPLSPSSPQEPLSPTSLFPGFEDFRAADKDSHRRTPPPRAIKMPSPSSSSGPGLTRAGADTLRCGMCSTDLAFGAQIVSKGFTGRHGRAYLVSPPSVLPSPSSCPGSPTSALAQAFGAGQNTEDLVNVQIGRPENRQLVTGAHVVADISCAVCGFKLGWKYVDAKEPAQRYKVGKFILETQRVVTFRSWEDANASLAAAVAVRDDYVEEAAAAPRRKMSGVSSRWSGELSLTDGEGDEAVEFDSDDEDECEDIFAGTWDPETVAQRRRSRVSIRKK